MSTRPHEEPARSDYFTPGQDALAVGCIAAIAVLSAALVVAVALDPFAFLSAFF